MDDWYGPEHATFGDRLAAARENAGLTQAALAKMVGVKASSLKGWEQDLSEPRANRLSMLAGVLNVSITWLLNGQGDGLEEPGEAQALPEDVSEILLEMRRLQTQIRNASDQLGRLEKRLRSLVQER